jgi:hypothetical protein
MEARFGLKYWPGLPIGSLSQDNGGWQPENVNGIKAEPMEIPPRHGCRVVIPPSPGVTHGKSPYGHQYQHLGTDQCP